MKSFLILVRLLLPCHQSPPAAAVRLPADDGQVSLPLADHLLPQVRVTAGGRAGTNRVSFFESLF